MYLCIENDGEITPEALHLMGASVKDTSKSIGMFGTGAKYGIATLVREGIEVIVYGGTRSFTFETREKKFRDKVFNQIVIRTGKRTISTSITAEMGKIRWSVDKALRELISNALDEGGASFLIVEEPNGERGKSRVFVRLTEDVRAFWDKRETRFTHFRSGPIYENKLGQLYTRSDEGMVRIYRRGVLANEFEGEARYDYSFNDVEVNEEREASVASANIEFLHMIDNFPADMKIDIVKYVSDHPRSFEADSAYSWHVVSPSWEEAISGWLLVTPEEYEVYHEYLEWRNPVILPTSWVNMLAHVRGVLRVKNVLSEFNLAGWVIEKPDRYTEDVIRQAVEFLASLGYPITREDIIVASNFRPEAPYGAFIDGKIYVNTKSVRKGLDETIDTVIHELFHKLSGYGDKSLEFEQYLMREIVFLLKRLHHATGGKI